MARYSKFVASQLGKFIWQDEMVYRSVLSECSLGVLSVFSGCCLGVYNSLFMAIGCA